MKTIRKLMNRAKSTIASSTGNIVFDIGYNQLIVNILDHKVDMNDDIIESYYGYNLINDGAELSYTETHISDVCTGYMNLMTNTTISVDQYHALIQIDPNISRSYKATFAYKTKKHIIDYSKYERFAIDLDLPNYIHQDSFDTTNVFGNDIVKFDLKTYIEVVIDEMNDPNAKDNIELFHDDIVLHSVIDGLKHLRYKLMNITNSDFPFYTTKYKNVHLIEATVKKYLSEMFNTCIEITNKKQYSFKDIVKFLDSEYIDNDNMTTENMELVVEYFIAKQQYSVTDLKNKIANYIDQNR